MIYANPWADSDNFNYLGTHTDENGIVHDLYYIQYDEPGHMSVGTRCSDEESDYHSYSIYKGKWRFANFGNKADNDDFANNVALRMMLEAGIIFEENME